MARKAKGNVGGESLTVNKSVRVRLKGSLFARTFRFAMFKYEAIGQRVVLNLVEMDTNRTLNADLDRVKWLTAQPATNADMMARAAKDLKAAKKAGAKLERKTKRLQAKATREASKALDTDAPTSGSV